MSLKEHGGLARIILYMIWFVAGVPLIFFSSIGVYNVAHPNSHAHRHIDNMQILLLASAVITFGFTSLILRHLWYRNDRNPNDPMTKNWFELSGLAFVWALQIGAAAATTATFSCPNGDELCDLLRGDLALAWFNVFLASILFWPSLIIVARRKSWNEKHFDTWGRHVFGMELKDRDDWGRRGQIKRARERQERTLVEERTVIDGRDEPIRAV